MLILPAAGDVSVAVEVPVVTALPLQSCYIQKGPVALSSNGIVDVDALVVGEVNLCWEEH